MIIGLNGRLKAGKDTTYLIIKEVLAERNDPTEVIQISFAKALKASAAASIGSSVVSLENWKGDEDAVFSRPDGTTFTAREYLQWYGTEGHRDLFGDDFWVDRALPINGKYSPAPLRAIDTNYSRAIYVVTDMRFPNEAQRVLDLKGHTVKVVREAETKFSAHASEQNIDHMIEYFLDNTTTIDELRERTKFMLDSFFQQVGIYDARSVFPGYATVQEAEDMRGWNLC